VFVLRQSHLKSLEAAPGRAFLHRLADHVRRVFPRTENLLAAELLQRVTSARDKARQYGLTTEKNVALYVDLGFGLGPNFESRPECEWIVRILEEPGHSEHAKTYLIYRDLPERNP
jgi:hypothetical protein